ncbi:hypothetical protein [Rhizobium sp. BK060]|uniref:hypothetical protein n=1 Tax=Rhizobium sp. BK060 TaxID=2587096 RepID=UPI00160E5632|nr:hypothetical protein [Rhizobium sp. BK060]MBB3396151.1 hypothetical protein [Rhizobium sp. BK060]
MRKLFSFGRKFKGFDPKAFRAELTNLNERDFVSWFAGSVLQDGGRPMVLLHGTCALIEEFRPLSHFGTALAARDGWVRSYNKNYFVYPEEHQFTQSGIDRSPRNNVGFGSFYMVAMRATRPIFLVDPGDTHDISVFVSQLLNAQILSTADAEAIMDSSKSEAISLIQDALLSSGFDSICYRNDFEDSGQMSFVNLFPEQIRPAFNAPNGLTYFDSSPLSWAQRCRAPKRI